MKAAQQQARASKPAIFTSISCDVSVADLFVDESYQRPLQKRHEPIVDGFDEHRFETLAVNERAGRRGKFAVIDGQARLAAARELQIAEVPCRVYDRLTVEQEAELFVKLQEGRKNLRPYDRFRAKERAGHKDSIEIHALVVGGGFEIGPNWKPGVIGAIRALEVIYRTHGGPILARLLDVITKAWGRSESGAMSSGMLMGLGRVLAVSSADDDVVSRLRRKRPGEVYRLAGALADGKVVSAADAKHVAEAIVAICKIPLDRPLDAAADARSRGKGQHRTRRPRKSRL